MKFLRLFITSFLILSLSMSLYSAQTEQLNSLRKEYMVALHDLEEVPRVYEKFLKVEKPSAKILAYTGALEAIMTKTTWNIFKKINYLKKSEETFSKAVAKDPNSVEIRFMRMAVQFEIPEYLGFSEDIYNDRDFIISNIHQFNTTHLNAEISSQIVAFMKRCGYFTPEQIDKFEGLLALKK